MTRKEEIDEASFVNGFNGHDKEIFTIGAEWADSRPRKGLVDIDKVCEWLALNAEVYGDINRGNLNIMIDIFKKEMEE